MRTQFSDTSRILNGSGVGVESNTEMWMSVFNLKTVDELKSMLSPKIIQNLLKNNEKAWNIVDNSVYCNKEILKLFDDWNDKRASNRIINFIENHV